MSRSPLAPNPFAAGTHPDPQWCFGRDAALAQLVEAFGNPRVREAEITGSRGVGKTALIARFSHEVASDGGGIVVAVDLRDHLTGVGSLHLGDRAIGVAHDTGIQNVEEARDSIARALAVALCDLATDVSIMDPDRMTAQRLYREVLPDLCRTGRPRVVFVVDEFDLVTPHVAQQVWRGVVKPPALNNLGLPPLFVRLVGRSWAGAATAAVAVEGRILTVHLGLLDAPTMRAVLAEYPRSGLFSFDPAAVNAIGAESAGYPMFFAAILDALYTARWEELRTGGSLDPRRSVSQIEVEAALARLENHFPDRIRHALMQAGPATIKTLVSLAREEGGATLRETLVDVVASAWRLVAGEVQRSLNGLRDSGLVEFEGGLVSLKIPLLRRLVLAFGSRQDLSELELPPLPEAFAAVQQAEQFEDDGRFDRAIEGFFLAGRLDPDYWLAQWGEARLRLDRVRRQEGDTRADLERAHELLEALLRRLRGTRRAVQMIRPFCEVLTRRASTLEAGSSERGHVLERLTDNELDPFLATPGARAAWDAHQIARWSQHIEASTSSALLTETRELLQTVHDRAAVAQRFVLRIREDRTREGGIEDGLRVVAGILPAVVELGMQEGDADDGLWREVVQMLEKFEGRSPPLSGSMPPFSIETWEALAAAPETWRPPLGRSVGRHLAAAIVRAVITDPTPEPERYVEALRALAPTLLSPTLQEISREVDSALGDRERLAALAEPLGRSLKAFSLDGGEAARDIARFFAYAIVADGGDDQVPVRATTLGAWRAVLGEGSEEDVMFLQRLYPRATDDELAEDISLADREIARRMLDREYELVRRCAYRHPSVATRVTEENVRSFEAKDPSGRTVLLRMIGLRAPDDVTYNLLLGMWEIEHRVLSLLGRTPAGRALPLLIEDRFDRDQRRGVVVHEWVGDRTLRELIGMHGKSLRDPSNPQAFWREVATLVEALNALHQRRFLHRGISPEAVLVRDAGLLSRRSTGDEQPALYLANFEMTVYLRGIRGGRNLKAKDRNRYLAPEVLRSLLGAPAADPEDDVGETFASDLYSLGLLLFECIVEPLAGEVGFYPDAAAYGPKAQQEHREWLKGLQDRVEAEERRGALVPQERYLLLSLLHASLGLRANDAAQVLKDLQPLAIGAAFGAARADRPVVVFTTLGPENWAAKRQVLRDDPKCIASFLRRQLPEVDAADVDKLSPAALRDMLQKELKGATVHPNRNRSGRDDDPATERRLRWFPFILRSRSGILFRVQCFRWQAVEGEPYTLLPAFAYLEVARLGDVPFGPPLLMLSEGVIVEGLWPAAVRERRDQHSTKEHPGWSDLWKLASVASAVDPGAARRQGLVDAVRIDADLAYEGARSEIAFVATENRLRSLDGNSNLAIELERWMGDDAIVVFAANARERGRPVGLDAARFDFEEGTVEVPDEIARLYPTGVVRPWGDHGVDALYRRHVRAIEEFADDAALLDAVSAPGDLPPSHPVRGDFGVVLGRLDADKRAVVQRFHEVPSLLAVEGPPGTGKTTLAAEVVFQVLARHPHARILITTQSHAPLDNLLERLVQERDASTAGRASGPDERARPSVPTPRAILEPTEIVRIPSGHRTRDYGRAAQFLPDVRANQMIDQLLLWAEREQHSMGPRKHVARWIIAANRGDRLRDSNALRRRLIASGNLVFVTASSPDLEAEAPGSFDLVIFEEAARAPVVEVLGAMRFARRWLLIGDHRQLPPYGVDGLDTRVPDFLRRRLRVPGDASEMRSEDVARLRDYEDGWRRYRRVFQYLHEQSGDHSATLATQWRMHPVIGEMVSTVFYEGKAVKNPTGDARHVLETQRVHPFFGPDWIKDKRIVWIDMPWVGQDQKCGEQRFAGGGLGNEAERRVIVAFLRALEAGKPTSDVAIITPYRMQVQNLMILLKENLNWFRAVQPLDQQVHTVDAFQGRQAGTVIVSLVRNNAADASRPRAALGFLDMAERNAVMFSRAEKLLVVVGCSEQFRRVDAQRGHADGPHWALQVFEHARRDGGVIPATALPNAAAEIDKVRLRRKGYLLNADGTEVRVGD